MRTLAITQNITLDGSIEMLDEWFDPEAMGDQNDMIEENHRQDSAADALLLGRQTFTDFRGYWPDVTDDPTGVSAYLDAVHKYVVSATLTEPRWQHTTVLSGDPIAQVRALKERPGKDIVLTGSITLAHAVIEAGLVDEYRLFVYPGGPGPRTAAVSGGLQPRLPAAARGALVRERRRAPALRGMSRQRP